MAVPAFNESLSRFDSSVMRLVDLRRLPLDRLGAGEIAFLSDVLRSADEFLGEPVAAALPPDPARAAVVAWVRLLRDDAARLLAVVGPDASWRGAVDSTEPTQETLVLSAEDSEFVARLLLDPPQPNERLRDAERRYRASTGI
jgi:hypothetical protein